MKMSEFIKFLKGIEKECGDKEVLLSSDYEGNSLANVDTGIGNSGKYIVIYPKHENLDLDVLDPNPVPFGEGGK